MSEKTASYYSQLADQVDAALSLVPSSPDGVDLAMADLLFLGPEISDALHEMAGNPDKWRNSPRSP